MEKSPDRFSTTSSEASDDLEVFSSSLLDLFNDNWDITWENETQPSQPQTSPINSNGSNLPTTSQMNPKKKRELDDHSESKEERTSKKQSLLTKDDVYSFYAKLVDAFNLSDKEAQTSLIDRFVSDDCLLQISTPAFSRESRGRTSIHQLYDSFQCIYPDAIAFHKVIHSIFNLLSQSICQGMLAKRDPLTRQVHITHKFTFSGTKAFSGMETESLFRIRGSSLVSSMDRSSLTSDQLRALVQMEAALTGELKLIIVFVLGKVDLLLDPREEKIVEYRVSWKVQSFKECS